MRGLLRPFMAGGAFFFVSALAACGGGGGGTSATPPITNPVSATPSTPTPSPSPVPISASSVVTVPSSGGSAAIPAFGGYSGNLNFPAPASGAGATLNVTSSLTPPSGVPALSSALRVPKGVGASALFYVALAPISSVAFASTAGLTLILPSAATPGQNYFLASYSSANASAGFQAAAGPASVSGSSVTFATSSNPQTLAAGTTYVYALYELVAPTPTPSPSATASPTPSHGPSASPSPTPAASPTPAPTLAPNVAYMSVNSSTNVSGVIDPNSSSAVVVGISQNTSIIGTTQSGSVGSASVNLTLGATSTSSLQRRVLGFVENPGGRDMRAPELFPAPGPERDRFLRSQLRPSAGLPLRVERKTKSLPTTAGSTASLWAQNSGLGSGSGTYTQVAATLVAVTAHGYIWVDNTLSTAISTPSTVTAIANDFENAYASDTTSYASPNYPSSAGGLQTLYTQCDANGNSLGTSGPSYILNTDQHIVVFVVNPASLGSGVGGYFDQINFYPQSILNCSATLRTSKSNEASMIYVGWFGPQGPPPATSLNYELQEDLVTGSAHEFQHLISFVNHVIQSSNPNAVSEDSWINEGMSMLSQDLAVNRMFPSTATDVNNAGSLAYNYLKNPQNYSVPGFVGISAGSLMYNCGNCYGAEYLFARYLRDRFGGDTYTQNMDRAGSGVSVSNLQSVTGQPAAQLLGDFAITLQNSGTGNSSSPQFNITSLNLRGTVSDQFGTPTTFSGPGTVASLQPGVQATYTNYLGANFYVNVTGLSAGSSVKLNDATGTYSLNGGIWQH